MVKVCPSSCHLAQVTPNVTFLWMQNGKEPLRTTMSLPYGHLLKYHICIFSSLSFQKEAATRDELLCWWPGSPKTSTGPSEPSGPS